MEQEKEMQVWHMLDTLNRLESEKYVKKISGKPVPKTLQEKIKIQRGKITGILQSELLEWIPKKTWSESEEGYAVTMSSPEDGPFPVDFISKLNDRERDNAGGLPLLPGIAIRLHPFSAVLSTTDKVKSIRGASKHAGNPNYRSVELMTEYGGALRFNIWIPTKRSK